LALAEYLGPRAHEFGDNNTLQAMVRPSGVLGALVAGFYEVTPSAYPDRTRVFLDAAEALAWLGVPDPAALLAEVSAAQAWASGTPPPVRALHDHVIAQPRGVTLEAAARALGRAPRQLQDELRHAGTSFRREVNAARVRAAQRLLTGSDIKLGAI